MNVCATFGESRLNSDRPEATSHVISRRFARLVVPDNRAKFGDHCLSLYRERNSTLKWHRGSFQPEVVNDVVSGVVVDPTGVKLHMESGDSRSNRFRDIRLPHFVTNGDDNDDNAGVRRRSSHKGKKKFSLQILLDA